MNVETGRYPYDRLQTNPATSLPDVVEHIFGLAQIEPPVRVLDAQGKRLPGTEVIRFANGACEHVAIFRNPQFDDGGWGNLPTKTEREWAGSIDNSNLEKDAQVALCWPSALPTYDIREKKELGETAKVHLRLDAFSPVVLTRTPQAVPPLRVEAPEQVRAGSPLMVTPASDAALPPGTFRVVHLELATPDGAPCDVYTRNVRLESTAHQEALRSCLQRPLRALATECSRRPHRARGANRVHDPSLMSRRFLKPEENPLGELTAHETTTSFPGCPIQRGSMVTGPSGSPEALEGSRLEWRENAGRAGRAK